MELGELAHIWLIVCPLVFLGGLIDAVAGGGGLITLPAYLLAGLPAGIRPGELRWEALCWERETGMFLRRGTLQCRAVFVAETGEDGTVFRDFILKGVMTN